MNLKENKIFAKGICFDKLFIFFVLGSLFGSFYEEIIFFFQTGSWTSRHDLLYGPFSCLYGFGVVLFLLLLGKKNEQRGIIKTFIYASLIGGITEYITGWLSEVFLHIRFWDYSNEFLNIHGRTTIPYLFAWGFFATILLKVIYPFLSKYIEKIPYQIGKVFCIMLLIFMIIDIFISYTAFFRMLSRVKGNPPKTFVGTFYDRVYPDDFMYKKFPILEGKIN